MARLDQIQWQLQKNITGDSFPVKERRSAEQPPLPCISNRKPNSRSRTLAASLTSNARNARVDRRPQTFPNQYDKAVSIYVLKLKALRRNLLSGIQLDPRAQIIRIHIFYVKSSAPGR